MKKTILAGVSALALGSFAGSALAADLPARPITKAPIMAPAYNWTGFYIGGHIGWGRAEKDWAQTFPAAFNINTASYDATGVIAGGQIGYNWQTGSWVFGVEVDGSWSDQSGNAAQTQTPTWRSFTDFNWIGTATGRVGYAFDRVLVYAKGGFAWADEDHSQTFSGGAAAGIPTLVSTTGKTHTGWVAGAGVEVALFDNWTGKVEYNYIDLGSENLIFNNIAPAPGVRAVDNWDIDQRIHAVKFGVNYRFGFGR